MPEAWLQPSIVLLDVGMATRLSLSDRDNMLGLFRAFTKLQGRDMARWVLKFSGDDQHCPQPKVRCWAATS